MCDFDIASFRERRSGTKKKKRASNKPSTSGERPPIRDDFAHYMKIRKTLGLDDSDSDSSSSSSSSSGTRKRKKKRTKYMPKRSTSFASDQETETSAATQSTPSSSQPPIQQPESDIPKSTIILSDVEDEPENTSLSILTQTTETQETNTTNTTNLSSTSTTSEQTVTAKKPSKPVIPMIEIDDLDPELALIAASSSSPLESQESSNTPQENAPQKIQIKVQFICLTESTDQKLQSIINMLKKPIKMIVMDNQPFEILLDHYCKKKCLTKDDVILVHNDVPLVLRATPASLDMKASKTNILEVYTRKDYEVKLTREQEKKSELLEKLNDAFDDTLFGAEDDPSSATKQEEGGERFFIKLRGKDNVDVTLRVKKTTTIAAITKEYVRIRALDPDLLPSIQLSFEGEVLSSDLTLHDTDLEDEDLVSVMF